MRQKVTGRPKLADRKPKRGDRKDREKLSARTVQTVPPPKKGRLEIADSEVPGLWLRVTPNGVKSWAIRYTVKGLGQRRVSYGTFPLVSLSDARTRAREILAAAARRVDLAAQEEQAAEEAWQAAEEAQKNEERPKTVGELLDRYISKYCKGNQRRWELTERMFEAHVKPALGSIPLTELRRAHVVEMLDDLQNEGGLRAQVNRVRELGFR